MPLDGRDLAAETALLAAHRRLPPAHRADLAAQRRDLSAQAAFLAADRRDLSAQRALLAEQRRDLPCAVERGEQAIPPSPGGGVERTLALPDAPDRAGRAAAAIDFERLPLAAAHDLHQHVRRPGDPRA